MSQEDQFRSLFLRSFDDNRFELFVFPTEQCNFRCTYCYEDFEVGKMSREVVERTKKFLTQRLRGVRHFTLQWFGGEPLVAFDVIRELSAHILRLRGEYGFELSGIMTTNAYSLSESALAELIACGTDTFQVSLDGPKEFHDRTRVKSGGQGTFDAIVANLFAARQSRLKFTIILRIHLTPENVEAMPDFARWLAVEFLRDERFVPYLVPVGKLGGPHDEQFDVLSRDRFAAAQAEVVRTLASVGEGAGDASLGEPAGEPTHSACYAAKPNSLIVRADGTLGKCTVALDDPRNAIGHLRDDGEVAIDQERFQLWLHGWESGNLEHVHCPLEHLSSFARLEASLPQ